MKLTIASGLGVTLVLLGTLHGALSRQKLCGPVLMKTLDLVCTNGVGGFKIKRDFPEPEDDYSVSNDEANDFQLGLEMFPFLSSEEANSLTKTRRRRHGIAHECCDKPCSLAELRSYCRPVY